ncbi:hypothetical protein L3X38_026449 [Prunus dulcis]|uniref:Uncharacterized protein n=1 Tax=Prunus dulcis TaxID=3755 RepID=A0AAD4Z081_PRUDU|nr:hypothetical protein L3X38_026449 [Prunus dulcis]
MVKRPKEGLRANETYSADPDKPKNMCVREVYGKTPDDDLVPRQSPRAFEGITFAIQQIPGAEYTHADALASQGSALGTQFKRSIPVKHLDQPSIKEAKPPNLMQIDEDSS